MVGVVVGWGKLNFQARVQTAFSPLVHQEGLRTIRNTVQQADYVGMLQPLGERSLEKGIGPRVLLEHLHRQLMATQARGPHAAMGSLPKLCPKHISRSLWPEAGDPFGTQGEPTRLEPWPCHLNRRLGISTMARGRALA